MPKLKVHRGTKKRFGVSGTGKIMRGHQGGTHLRTRKSKRVKNMFNKKEVLSPADRKRISRLMP